MGSEYADVHEKARKGKVIWNLEDAFLDTPHGGGEEWRKLWQLYRDETDEETILRRVRRDAMEHQTKYLACAQSVTYSLCLNLGIGNKDVWKFGAFICTGMGGWGSGRFGGTQVCGSLIAAKGMMGVACGRMDYHETGMPRCKGDSVYGAGWGFSSKMQQLFEEHFGSITCDDIQKGYFGRSWFKAEDYDDPKQAKMHESNEMYQLVSTYAAQVAGWTAETCAKLILENWRERGIPLRMPLR